MTLKSTAILALAFFVSTIAPAHAYIDPGSGSVLTTAIVGFFAAIAYTFRKYFYKAKSAIFGRNTNDKRR